MKIAKGDYVIVDSNDKYHLMKALTDSEGKTFEAVNEKMCHIQKLRLTATIGVADVVLNLGSEPKPGYVYGLDVGLLHYAKKVHPKMGTINFFYKPEREVVRDLWSAFDKVDRILTKRGLDFLTDGICWEVQPEGAGTHAGMFINPGKEGIPRRIQIRPESMSASDYPYVILHELAHNLHHNYVTSKKINALWLRLFNTSIKPVMIDKATSIKLLDMLMSQEDVPSAFKGQLDEDDKIAFTCIVRAITQVHQVGLRDLDLLFEADMRDDIQDLWPKRSVHRKELAPIISKYATKNHHETFAEAVSFVLTGKKLPDPIVRLVEKTISHAKSNK